MSWVSVSACCWAGRWAAGWPAPWAASSRREGFISSPLDGAAGRSRPRPWLGSLLVALGIAAVLAIGRQPPQQLSAAESGILYAARDYQRMLPLLAFGCALGQARLRAAAGLVLLFVAGLGGGLFGEDRLLALSADSSNLWKFVVFVAGPLSCVVIGLTLALGDRWRPRLLPFAAIALGAFLGVAAQLNTPGLDDGLFAAGAATVALWVIASIALLWAAFERPWFRIAGRILGSWLIAIGLLLGSTLLPRQSRLDMPAAPSTDETYEIHRGTPPLPGNNQALPPSLMAPGFDPSRQP